MAAKLKYHCFQIESNPNGILFNPVSLAQNIHALVNRTPYSKADLIENNGLWHSWNHHSSCSSIDAEKMISKLNATSKLAADHLAKSKVLMITFGTAFAYQYKATGQTVANCHKVPNHQFDKVRLSNHHMIGIWQDTLEQLLSINPDMQVVMTVSPVRHIKDGIVANQRSKAMLLLVIEALTQQFSNVHYFPSYEVMMDDLRDYRFYKSDMLHPTDQAVDYIWSRFVETYMDEPTRSQMKEVAKLQQARAHRPHHPDSSEAIAFQEMTERKWKEMLGKLKIR